MIRCRIKCQRKTTQNLHKRRLQKRLVPDIPRAQSLHRSQIRSSFSEQTRRICVKEIRSGLLETWNKRTCFSLLYCQPLLWSAFNGIALAKGRPKLSKPRLRKKRRRQILARHQCRTCRHLVHLLILAQPRPRLPAFRARRAWLFKFLAQMRHRRKLKH